MTSAASNTPNVHISQMEYVRCALCGNDDYFERFPDTRPGDWTEDDWGAFLCTHPGYGVHPPVVQCRNCQLVYTNPRRQMDVIAQNYASVEDPQYLEQRPSREATFWKHLQSLERYSGSGEGRRLLDIGAYIGVFVDTANQAGWQSTGLEPSAWASSYAVRSGLDVVCGTLETADFPPESFDVITMWDVFEHLSDPMGALDRCYSWLKPGGWIANHTMDIDSLFARLMGRRWPWLMEMHIYYFSNHTLTAIHEKAGFRVESVRPEGRYIRLTYLTTRMRPYSNLIANAVDRVSHFWGLENFMVPINFGDLVTIYAQKPLGE